MKDIIITIIAGWFVYKIFNSINAIRTQKTTKREGETTVNYSQPKKKNNNNNDAGEYIDYEEIK